VRKLARGADLVVCADGGANHARRMKITPTVILGDLDSISVSTKRFFRKIPLLQIKDQESTDLEKAIGFCIARHAPCADVVGATGDRIDHSTGGLGCFKKFGRRIELRMYDTVGFLSLVRGTSHLKMKKGETLSLIPLERCRGVSTRNLLYRLSNDVLELGVREGISNEATSSLVRVSVKSGTLLLYRFF
jgi:thiamine pyrophosphokinase